MSDKLEHIAKKLKNNDKVQLIYAFNGTGKTLLSREFKELIAPKDIETEQEQSGIKILYYNAFTEDLFYWDNDLDTDTNRKLIIRPNNFTEWVLQEQGQERNIISHFQHYTTDKLTPKFNESFSEVTFSISRGDEKNIDNIKISKGEESCFIWSVFYSLLTQVVSVLNTAEPSNRETEEFDNLQYVFIDDPVSSLDENNLIELAVNIAQLIRSNNSGLKFIITTHNPLFYNVLSNELNLKNKGGYLLDKFEDGTFELIDKKGDSNTSFSYHLHLKNTIEKAIINDTIQKYHFTLLRNLYEKTASFLGYTKWSELLPDDKKPYYNRVIQFTSHSTLSNEVIREPTDVEKKIVKFLLEHLVNNNHYWKEK